MFQLTPETSATIEFIDDVRAQHNLHNYFLTQLEGISKNSPLYVSIHDKIDVLFGTEVSQVEIDLLRSEAEDLGTYEKRNTFDRIDRLVEKSTEVATEKMNREIRLKKIAVIRPAVVPHNIFKFIDDALDTENGKRRYRMYSVLLDNEVRLIGKNMNSRFASEIERLRSKIEEIRIKSVIQQNVHVCDDYTT